MGHNRIVYGLAYGRQNNFYTGISGQKGYLAGTAGLFAQANTAPDITDGVLFYTNNSSGTVINSFTISHPSMGSGNLAGLYEGKIIKIVFLDSNTTVAGSRFFLSTTNNLFAQNSYLELLYHNSGFYEISRSNVYSDAVSLNIAGSAGINANFTTSFLLNGTGATNVIQSISNGMIGQRLLLINNNSTSTISISTFGNIIYSFTPATYFPGSGGGLIVVLAASGVAELVKIGNAQWSLIGK